MKSEIERLKKYLEKENILDENILDIILVGSRLYNTHSQNSDFDFIVITDSKNGLSINKVDINATIYSKDSFIKALSEQKMTVLEAYFSSYKYKHYKFIYVFNKDLLIKNTKINIDETIKRSNSNNHSLGRKQLFHAIRINHFKNQLLKNQKIVDFSEANKFWFELRYCYDSISNLIKQYENFIKD